MLISVKECLIFCSVIILFTAQFSINCLLFSVGTVAVSLISVDDDVMIVM